MASWASPQRSSGSPVVSSGATWSRCYRDDGGVMVSGAGAHSQLCRAPRWPGSCSQLLRQRAPRFLGLLICVFRCALSGSPELGLTPLCLCLSDCPGLHQQQLFRQEGELEGLASNHRYEEALVCLCQVLDQGGQLLA